MARRAGRRQKHGGCQQAVGDHFPLLVVARNIRRAGLLRKHGESASPARTHRADGIRKTQAFRQDAEVQSSTTCSSVEPSAIIGNSSPATRLNFSLKLRREWF